MSKLSPVSWRELVKRLRQLGFEGPFEGGQHPYMVHGYRPRSQGFGIAVGWRPCAVEDVVRYTAKE